MTQPASAPHPYRRYVLRLVGSGARLPPRALDPRSRSIFVGVGLLFLIAGVGALIVLRTIPVRRFPFRIRRKMVAIRAALRALASQPERVVASALLGMLPQT